MNYRINLAEQVLITTYKSKALWLKQQNSGEDLISIIRHYKEGLDANIKWARKILSSENNK